MLKIILLITQIAAVARVRHFLVALITVHYCFQLWKNWTKHTDSSWNHPELLLSCLLLLFFPPPPPSPPSPPPSATADSATAKAP